MEETRRRNYRAGSAPEVMDDSRRLSTSQGDMLWYQSTKCGGNGSICVVFLEKTLSAVLH